MSTRYGRSVWLAEYPSTRVPKYPSAREAAKKEALAADVVIIGGGLVGCATAYAFAAAGLDVALFEADRIGQGSSGAGVGWISETPDTSFADAQAVLGLRGARHVWQIWRRGARDVRALLKRLKVKCDLEPVTPLTCATTLAQSQTLTREKKARAAAKLDAAMLTAAAATMASASHVEAALRSGQADTLDPYRATLGLAGAASAKGARIFERSPVTRTRFTRTFAEVATAAGVLRVQRVIVATGAPTPLFRPLQRHFVSGSTFAALTNDVPAALRKRLLPSGVVIRDLADPPHMVRWVGDRRLLVTGADGPALADRQVPSALLQRTGQLMYELSLLYPDMSGVQPALGWHGPYARAVDGVPVFGAHRNYPFHLFALGDASSSVTGAYVASRLLLRLHQGAPEPGDEALAFRR